MHRFFAGVIAVAAAFVTWLGFFSPETLDEKFTWAVLPPLHARFVGALYLFGAVYVLGAAVSRHRARWWPAMTGIAIFTGSMIVLTAFNRDAFDMDLGGVRAWVASYVVYPPVAAAIAVWIGWRRSGPPSGPTPVAPWMRTSLTTLAVVFGAVGVALLVARDAMADVWPWPVTIGVAQFYGGPFITLAWICGAHGRSAHAAEDLTYVNAGLLSFATSTLVFSVHHRALFDGGDPVSWLWFAWLVAIAVTAGAHLMATVLARRPVGTPAVSRAGGI